MRPETERDDLVSGIRLRAPALEGARIDFGLLPDLTGFSVKLVWILGHGLLGRAFGESGITPHRFSVLEVIGRNPGLQQTQLAAALALTRPATTLAIDFWEERACVERRKILGDRRSFGVYPTDHGTAELERLRAAVREADQALTAGLTAAETRELQRLLKKIHR
jgi:DNA-binding MarR family transcriptional regulator